MPQYFSPGVYVEEIDTGPRPIAGVSTSIAGMVGVTARGPTAGKPTLVTSFLDFRRRFGGFLPNPEGVLRTRWEDLTNLDGGGRWWLFPYAVQAFFDNGGQQLFVKRVAPALAARSVTTFSGGLVSDVTANAAGGAGTLTLEHVVGIDPAGPAVTVVWRDGGSPASLPLQVSGYDAQARTITFTPPLPRAVRAGRDFVQIKAPQAPNTLVVNAAAAGTWGDGIQVVVRPSLSPFNLLANPGEGDAFVTQVAVTAPQNSATVVVSAVPGLAVGPPPNPGAPFFVRIGPRRFEVASIAAGPQPGQVELTLQGNPPHRQWDPPLVVRRVRRANPGAPGPTLRVAGAGALYAGAVAELDNGTAKQPVQVTGVQGDVVTFGTNPNAGYFEGDRLNLVEMEIHATYVDELGGVTDERFQNLHLRRRDATGALDEQAAESRINGTSSLITVSQLVDLDNAVDLRLPVPASVAGTGATVALAGGDDNYELLSPADFVGLDGGSGRRTGIQALEDIDEVAIVAVPGMWGSVIQSALIQHCEILKDRFAILDPPDPLGITEVLDFRQAFDTKYAALYYPWLVTLDPATTQDVTVPPSGHLAGIYARVDNERGVHKAPANVVIRSIKPRDGIAQDVTKREQDLLNPKGVNALRAFPNLGQRVWGARTLSSDTPWKYVNVRRLFIFVEESLDEGTQWVVFEPNDEPLWALVRQTIANFLNSLWRNGQLAGATPAEAYFVTCDRTTMTPEDLEQGRLIVLVGIAPVFPAEFVIIRIQQLARVFQRA
jgi:phage tail sheath protein FI